jgi:6-phosphogluconate dehydrogenase (decarboxylating)
MKMTETVGRIRYSCKEEVALTHSTIRMARWTIKAAIDEAVPDPVLSTALY